MNFSPRWAIQRHKERRPSNLLHLLSDGYFFRLLIGAEPNKKNEISDYQSLAEQYHLYLYLRIDNLYTPMLRELLEKTFGW